MVHYNQSEGRAGKHPAITFRLYQSFALLSNRLTIRLDDDTMTVSLYKAVKAISNGNKQRYIDDYKRQHYDRINIFLPIGYKEKIKRLASSKNLSVSKFILECIESQYPIDK